MVARLLLFPNIQMAVLWGTFRWPPLVCHTHGKCIWIFSLYRRARASSDLLVLTQIELDLKQMTKLKIFYKTQIARHWILRFSYVSLLGQTKVWTNVFTNKLQKVIEVSYRITETSCKLQKKHQTSKFPMESFPLDSPLQSALIANKWPNSNLFLLVLYWQGVLKVFQNHAFYRA